MHNMLDSRIPLSPTTLVTPYTKESSAALSRPLWASSTLLSCTTSVTTAHTACGATAHWAIGISEQDSASPPPSNVCPGSHEDSLLPTLYSLPYQIGSLFLTPCCLPAPSAI